jgi:hypothetical protein
VVAVVALKRLSIFAQIVDIKIVSMLMAEAVVVEVVGCKD